MSSPDVVGEGHEGRGDEERLAGFLDEVLGAPGHEVVGLTRLSGGASRDTWSFELVAPHGSPGSARPLIVQRMRRGALPVAGGMAGEATLVQAAGVAGVPVPDVVAGSDDPAILGSPFVVTERLAGETLAPRLLRDERWAAVRPKLVGQSAAALAAIHRIDTDGVTHLRKDDPVRQLRMLLDGLDVARPAFELALRWLEDRRPDPVEARVVHGDFRLGNLLVDEHGLRAVLDWELAHLGDPLEDLGWFCVRAWRFGHRPPVAGLGEREELWSAYEAAGGTSVDPEAARWWEVLGTLRWGVICALQASAHTSGASRSVELAAIGRRVCETEYDLLLLLGSSPIGREELLGRLGPVHWDGASLPTPDALELLDAVREFVDGAVKDATEGRVRFHARVAANVLAALERELGSLDRRRTVHADRLAALGLADDRSLAAAIRAGRADADVRAAVDAGVLDALAVTNPEYVVER